ncbi:MAG: hypothetical protein EOO38_11845 [Cytophagaceae bacterium]|nr:MAG: hypothetical protein EOO38_11845 [Cytophagaceae bacterium]
MSAVKRLSPKQLKYYGTGLLCGLVAGVLLGILGIGGPVNNTIHPTATTVWICLAAGVFITYIVHFGLVGMDSAEDFLNQIPGFTLSQMTPSRKSFGSVQHGTFLAIDKTSRRFAILERSQGKSSIRVFEPIQLLNFEITEDGNTMFSTRTVNASGQSTGGVIPFGALGSAVWTVTAKKKAQQNVDSLLLRVYVQDLQHPSIEIPFLTSATSRGSTQHIKARQEAIYWQGVLTLIKG